MINIMRSLHPKKIIKKADTGKGDQSSFRKTKAMFIERVTGVYRRRHLKDST